MMDRIDSQDHDAAAVRPPDFGPAPAGAKPDIAWAERELRVSEAKFAGIIAIASDAIISVDEDQRITLFNQGAEAIFGYAAAEVIGQKLEILLPHRFRAVHA